MFFLVLLFFLGLEDGDGCDEGCDEGSEDGCDEGWLDGSGDSKLLSASLASLSS